MSNRSLIFCVKAACKMCVCPVPGSCTTHLQERWQGESRGDDFPSLKNEQSFLPFRVANEDTAMVIGSSVDQTRRISNAIRFLLRLMAVVLLLSSSDQAFHTEGCGRNLRNFCMERSKGIFHGGDQGGRSRNSPSFTNPFGPQWVQRRRRFQVSDRDIRHLSCSRHQVVYQRACQQLPSLVVSYFFEQPGSDTGDNSSHHLALNDQGI